MNENKVSCVIHGRGGAIKEIEAARPPRNTVPPVPTIAALVPVGDVMTREVICAHGDLSVESVVELLVIRRVGCVPVVDDDGCPIGMITKSDLVEWIAAEPSQRARTAAELMLPLALTLEERATVASAAGLMAADDVHHVPVVSRKGRIVGIVSSLDIVRWLARNDRE